MLNSTDKQWLRTAVRDYINDHCIFRCNPEVQYVQGIPKGTIPGNSPDRYMTWQFFLRRLTHNSDMMAATSILMSELFKENSEPTSEVQMAGMETSSLPIISFMQGHLRSQGYYYNSFSVRKERKMYGLFNIIDGRPEPCPVMVIDDIFNSGSTIHRVLDTALYEYDLNPHSNSYVIVKLSDSTASHLVNNGFPIKINHLFTKNDFDLNFSEEKYWIPDDCRKDWNYRPDYF